jgi:hypothetical protein
MDSTNLATLFAPNILHCFKPGAKEVDKPEERADAINVTRSLIDHHGEVFEVSEWRSISARGARLNLAICHFADLPARP